MPDKYKIMHPIFVFAKQNYDNYFLPVNEQLAKKEKLLDMLPCCSLFKPLLGVYIQF